MPRRELIICNVQVAFCTPESEKAVRDAHLIIPVINNLKTRRRGSVVQPLDFYDRALPFWVNPESTEWLDGKAFHPELRVVSGDASIAIFRGQDLDGVSAFEDSLAKSHSVCQSATEVAVTCVLPQQWGSLIWDHKKSKLFKILSDEKVSEVDIVGVALGTIVVATAKAAAGLGHRARIIADAVASMKPDRSENLLRELREDYGVYHANSSEFLRESRTRKSRYSHNLPYPKNTDG